MIGLTSSFKKHKGAKEHKMALVVQWGMRALLVSSQGGGSAKEL